MVILKVKEKGHLIDLPGMKPIRTPAEINISKYNADVIITFLRSRGIKDYIIVERDNKEKTPSNKRKKSSKTIEYDESINKRFNNLERLIGELDRSQNRKKGRNENENLEQITEKLDVLEKLAKKLVTKQRENILEEEISEEPEIEELDKVFIPDVDIGKMYLRSGEIKTVKKDKVDLDNVDLLSNMLGKE